MTLTFAPEASRFPARGFCVATRPFRAPRTVPSEQFDLASSRRAWASERPRSFGTTQETTTALRGSAAGSVAEQELAEAEELVGAGNAEVERTRGQERAQGRDVAPPLALSS